MRYLHGSTTLMPSSPIILGSRHEKGRGSLTSCCLPTQPRKLFGLQVSTVQCQQVCVSEEVLWQCWHCFCNIVVRSSNVTFYVNWSCISNYFMYIEQYSIWIKNMFHQNMKQNRVCNFYGAFITICCKQKNTDFFFS